VLHHYHYQPKDRVNKGLRNIFQFGNYDTLLTAAEQNTPLRRLENVNE
jgi:hypothetical protein